MDKPKTHDEMDRYMRRIGLQEGDNFHAIIVENGWAETEDEARKYLESLNIFPWDD